MIPALKNHHPSIGKIPGIHIDLMKDSAPPTPSKPPKTIPMVPNSASPRRRSTIANMRSAMAHPNIQKPRSGADSTPTCPVAKAKIPTCNAPTRYRLAAPPGAHSCSGLESLSCFIFLPAKNTNQYVQLKLHLHIQEVVGLHPPCNRPLKSGQQASN